MSNWTQACCNACWDERNPERAASRIKTEFAEEETCCYCGGLTRSGIYVRVDPSTVPFAQKEPA